MTSRRAVALLSVLLVSGATVRAQDAAKDQADTTTTTTASRPTGLPSMIDWDFHFDGAAGGFGFGNSFYTDPHQGVPQDYGDRWAEGFAKPSLSGVYSMSSKGELYGKLSVVGERTYSTPPGVVGPVESSFLPEDLSIGWRSGKRW